MCDLTFKTAQKGLKFCRKPDIFQETAADTFFKFNFVNKRVIICDPGVGRTFYYILILNRRTHPKLWVTPQNSGCSSFSRCLQNLACFSWVGVPVFCPICFLSLTFSPSDCPSCLLPVIPGSPNLHHHLPVLRKSWGFPFKGQFHLKTATASFMSLENLFSAIWLYSTVFFTVKPYFN